MIKRFSINLLIIFITFMGVIYGYTQSFSLSKFDRFSYAEADNWSSCDTSDLVTAFRYYCKSRNLAIEGSVADALTSFTTTTFNNICSTLGIDPTSLSAELKKTTEGNLGLRFLFSNTGITAYNRIFAEFLQNNDLSVGDEVDNEVVYSTNVFIDDDGYKCIPYVIHYSGGTAEIPNSSFVSSGTFYKYSHSDIYSGLNCVFNVNGRTYNATVNSGVGAGQYWSPMGRYFSFSDVFYAFIGNGISDGNVCIIYNTLNQTYVIASIGLRGNMPSDNYYRNTYSAYVIADITGIINDDNVENSDVYITTNNNTINNNTYNNNYVIIYNDGDTYISDDDDEPLPTTPPDGGGGGGGDPDPTPSGPDSPDWQTPHGHGTIGSDGTFDFDIPFSLPNLNIDWSLKDIGHKFPFCIPGDIVSFYQTLAVEPRAPSIDAHIPLGSFYDWHFVADFSQYNTWAVIIRAVEYVGFVIGLIYFTVRLVKG